MTKLPWLLALALAGIAGWSVNRTISLQSDLDTMRAEDVPPAHPIERSPSPTEPALTTRAEKSEVRPPETAEEALALMGLVQAARIDELEEQNATLETRLAELAESLKSAARLKKEAEKDLRAMSWKCAVRGEEAQTAKKEIQRVTEIARQAEADYKRLLAILMSGPRNRGRQGKIERIIPKSQR